MTFQIGNTHGKGRIKGSRNWSTLMKEHLRSDWPQLAAAILDKELEGRSRWAFDALKGMNARPRGEEVEFDFSEVRTMADVLSAQNEVMRALAGRCIRTSEAQELMANLAAIRQTIQFVGVEERIDKIEASDARKARLRKALEKATKR
ncbi:MAG: hypothetical protein KIT25_17100 [Enhydrobacter sp.]|nr:MAG: hypothetical protein KIT25_17100 [Enhydrobacter sp.]